VLDVPTTVDPADDARLDVVAHRELEQLFAPDAVRVLGQRARREQRLLLPVPPHELRGSQTGEKSFFHVKKAYSSPYELFDVKKLTARL
jgi:hypothetical protein